MSQCSLQKAAAETSEAPAAAADWNLAKLVLFKVHKLGSEEKKKKGICVHIKTADNVFILFCSKTSKVYGVAIKTKKKEWSHDSDGDIQPDVFHSPAAADSNERLVKRRQSKVKDCVPLCVCVLQSADCW